MFRRYGLQLLILVFALVLIDAMTSQRFPYDRPAVSAKGNAVVVTSPTQIRVLRPNATFTEGGVDYRTNALGFRDPERSREKSADVTRILMMGDSFVEGTGERREDTIPARLERRLSESLSRPVEVWNCGVRGASPAVYRWWAPTLAAYAPDAVVIALTDSDLDDDARAVFTREQYQARFWRALPSPLRRSGLVTHLTGALASLRCSAVRLRLGRRLRYNPNDEIASWGPSADVNPGSLEQLSDPERASQDWERTRHFLNQTVEELNERGIPLLIVHIPAQLTVPAKPGDPRAENPGPDTPAFRHDLFADWLEGWARLAGTPFVDLGPLVTDWYRSAKNAPLYQAAGFHLNADGLEKAAEWIEPELESVLLVHTARRARTTIAP